MFGETPVMATQKYSGSNNFLQFILSIAQFIHPVSTINYALLTLVPVNI